MTERPQGSVARQPLDAPRRGRLAADRLRWGCLRREACRRMSSRCPRRLRLIGTGAQTFGYPPPSMGPAGESVNGRPRYWADARAVEKALGGPYRFIPVFASLTRFKAMLFQLDYITGRTSSEPRVMRLPAA